MTESSVLTIKQAAAAIVGIINASPRSPRQAEIEAIIARAAVSATMVSLSHAQARVLEAVHELVAAEGALGEDPDDDAMDACGALRDRVDETAKGLPAQRSSIVDIILRAQVAWCHADRDPQGRLIGLSDDDDASDDQATAAQLIRAVLQFAGIDFH